MKEKIYINGKFLNQAITGVQRTAHELIKGIDELIDQGIINRNLYDIILIYPQLRCEAPQYKFVQLLQKGILSGNLWEQIELPAYTRGHVLLSLCMISTLFKRKQIVIVHDASCYVNPQFFSFAFRSWYKFAIYILGKISLKIVTVSEFSKKELVKYAYIDEKKISVISNAADHILYRGKPSEEFRNKIKSNQPYLLAVSSLGENKNFKKLSEAFSELKFRNFKLIIAGGVSNTLNIERSNSVAQYLGYVTDNELKYLYEHAALFIFPSFYEGFGIPPLEAMILNCPVLSSNTSAMPEVLEDGVVYCNPYDVEDIAKKIQQLIDDPKALNALKTKGLEQAKKYNWQLSCEFFFNIVKNCI